MALEQIVGQPRAVELLRRALASDRVAHAYAFVGPTGSGRMTTALALGEALLGSPSPNHPDLHVIVPTPPETSPRGARATASARSASSNARPRCDRPWRAARCSSWTRPSA